MSGNESLYERRTMTINPAAATSATTRVAPTQAARPAADVMPPTTAKADRADVTGTAGFQRLMEMAKGGEELRADKVADVRAQIAAGTYDLDAKADVVANRMLDDMGL
jgi:negative regulator of flagellin synthesis FlgM